MEASSEHPWHVEAARVDRGGGLLSGYEVRHGDDTWCVTDVAGLAGFLADRGVDPSQITAPETGLRTGEDGCE